MAAIRKNTKVTSNDQTDILKVVAVSTDDQWARVEFPDSSAEWRHVSTLTVVPRVRKSRAKVTAVEAAAE